MIVAGIAALWGVVDAGSLMAQGVTTGAVRGTVRMADQSDPDGARVVVRSAATGFVVEVGVVHGRFLIQGLETGGPYSITVGRIGAQARRWDGVFLGLGDPLQLDVVLEPAPVQLDSIVTVAVGPVPLTHDDGGTATTLSDSLIHRLPSLNRNVYDFLRLVPQISTRIGFTSGGISGGAAGFRNNQFLTNGVPERSLLGGQPPEFAGGKSLPFEAVGEYQALVAPFDVRYGDFTGALVNSVTRSGTNRFAGSAFVQGRSDALASAGELSPSPYERWQFGLTFSGPIARDKAHFLFASEWQDLDAPMAGPYIGQPAGAGQPVPVSAEDIARMNQILQPYGLLAGSGGAVPNEGRQRNIFARIDAAVPGWRTRAVLWFNEAHARSLVFSREGTVPDSFPLSTYTAGQMFTARALALQAYSTLGDRGAAHNELSLSYRTITNEGVKEVDQPIIRVAAPGTAGGVSRMLSGAQPQQHGSGFNSTSVNLRDVLTFQLGSAHALSIGLEAEWFRAETGSLANSYGTWSFQSLDSLEAGEAERYDVSLDFGGASVPLSGGQYALYAGDHWRAGDRVSITFGLRADLLTIDQQAPYNPDVYARFGRRTDLGFGSSVEFAPRFGFNWNLDGTGRDLVRGGVGLFTGRPPLAWLLTPLQNYGTGIGSLRCGTSSNDQGLPPAFRPDAANPPDTCRDGGTPPSGDVELITRDLGVSRTLRGVLAYERRLPWKLLGTFEALYTHGLSDFAFANLNLVGPQGTDRNGRVLYGQIDAQGRGRAARVDTTLPSVIELRNVSTTQAVQLALSLAREFERGFSVSASYTWSRARDAQTPLRVNTRGILNWASRAVSGSHENLEAGTSLNDVPDRVALAATWRAPWQKWTTELSLLYVGESGSPFTWLYRGSGGRGDLNADGALNDPIYVPTSALDPAEIQFTGVSPVPGADNSPAALEARIAAQRSGFEEFIEASSCLRSQRGRLLARNSCREPWANTTALSLRQGIPIGGRTLEVQVDLFNVLNLLYSGWGRRLVLTSPAFLEHVSQTPGASGQPEPLFRFNESMTAWRVDQLESAFQFQLGLRYRL